MSDKMIDVLRGAFDYSILEEDRRAVRDVIQRGYGDATQTILDDQVAGNILTELKTRGWISLQEVGAIVAASGGEVRVTVKDIMTSYKVTSYQEIDTRDRIIKVEVEQ